MLDKMIQIAEERIKEISERQMLLIGRTIQGRDFNLSEHKRLKEVLEHRIITRHDAPVFLEYCFAKVCFKRYSNGHEHKEAFHPLAFKTGNRVGNLLDSFGKRGQIGCK